MSEWPQAQDPNPQPTDAPAYGQQPQYGQPYAQPYAQPYGGQQYPPDQYGQPPNPYGQYPPNAYGYAPPGYSAYGPPPGERRPGTLTAAAVLGYVNAGLLIFAGIILFFGASAFLDLQNNFDEPRSGYIAELVVSGIVNLIAAGLLIAGSVSMTGRNAKGRTLFGMGCALVIAATVYWIARWATKTGLEFVLIYALLFAALAVVGAAMAYTGNCGRWLARR